MTLLLKIKHGRSRKRAHGEELMIRRTTALCPASMVIAAYPAHAADVTPERLLNPATEPQKWPMNHRTDDGQRNLQLARISRDTSN
jgi:hypothetical protein